MIGVVVDKIKQTEIQFARETPYMFFKTEMLFLKNLVFYIAKNLQKGPSSVVNGFPNIRNHVISQLATRWG